MLGISSLALFLRVWQLNVLPPGLHYDEAFNGTVAREVLRAVHRPIFFTENFGEEPLHMYTEALLFEFLPESPWTIRLVSAVFGVILVAAVYACARAFFPRADLLALFAAFLAATLYWAINFSRIGIETNSLPPLLTLSAAALAHAYRKMSWRWIAGAGFLVGATMYTYLAARVWLLAVFVWFVYLVIFYRAHVRAHFSGWLALGIFALVTLAPLALFFIENPIAFTGRAGTVFTPETFLVNLARTAGMFFWSGDTDPRDNLPGRPALDILLALFLITGLVITLARFRKPFYAFLFIWFVVMSLPSALTEFAPNFRRAIGAMPATILLCAVGVEWLWKQVDVRRSSSIVRASSVVRPFRVPRLQQFGQTAIIAALALSAFWSARAYFVEWASGTGLYYSFDAGLLQVGKALAGRPPEELLYLTPDYDSHYTVLWALDGRPLASFDGRRVLVLPDSRRAATYGIITHEDRVTQDALTQSGVPTKPLLNFMDTAGSAYATLLATAPYTRSDTTKLASADDFAELRSATVSPEAAVPGGTLHVLLEWFATKPARRDFTVSVQLIGPPNPALGSPLWAQDDKQPGGGTYPTTAWRSGESILEPYTLKIPVEAPPGRYKIQVGMYLLETNERVPLFDAGGMRLDTDALTIDTLALR